MEYLNKVELRGVVGFVRQASAGERKVLHVSLGTSAAFRGKDGDVIETTWHNVTLWEGRNVPDLDTIVKGTKLCVWGRIRNQHYTGSDGADRMSVDIIANKATVINPDEQMQEEMN